MATEFTDSNFKEKVLDNAKLSIIDFWAEWCGPCKVLGPIVEEIAEEYKGKLKVGKLNVDEEGPISMKYNVMSIPTLKFFKNGELVGEIVGAAPKATIESEIAKHI